VTDDVQAQWGHWLVIRNPRTGRLIRCEEFRDGEEAVSALQAEARKIRYRIGREGRVLGGQSLEDVRTRYPQWVAPPPGRTPRQSQVS